MSGSGQRQRNRLQNSPNQGRKKEKKKKVEWGKNNIQKTPHHHPNKNLSVGILPVPVQIYSRSLTHPCQGKRILLGPCWWSSQGKKLRVVKILNQTGHPGDCRDSQGQALPNRSQAQKPCSQGQALPNRSRAQKIQSWISTLSTKYAVLPKGEEESGRGEGGEGGDQTRSSRTNSPVRWIHLAINFFFFFLLF